MICDSLHRSDDEYFAVSGPAHISCSAYINEKLWRGDFNDKLFVSGRAGPMWTHLKVNKAHLLSRWPRPIPPTPLAKTETACCEWLMDEMRRSPAVRPKAKAEFFTEARARFPNLGKKQFARAWVEAIRLIGCSSWSKSGRPPAKSIRYPK